MANNSFWDTPITGQSEPVDPNTGLITNNKTTPIVDFWDEPSSPNQFYGGSSSEPTTFDPSMYNAYLPISVSPKDIPQLEGMMGEEQGFLTEMFNSGVQALGTSVGQMIEGTGWLMNGISKLAGNDTYDNPLADFGKGITEWSKGIAPIYGNSTREQFFRNIPSVASSLSLMIPGFGAASLATRAFGLSSLLAKTSPLLATLSEPVAAAIFSRHMESMMEGSEVYHQEYNKLIEAGKSEEEARTLAKEAGDQVYFRNLPLVLSDFTQFLTLLKPLKALNNIPKLAELVGSGVLEGGEEGYQYYQSQLALFDTDKKAGIAEGKGWSDYFDDTEALSSIFYGALGGIMMGSPAGEKLSSGIMNKLSGAKYRNPDLYYNIYEYNKLTKDLNKAEKAGNVDAADNIRDQIVFKLGINAAKNGKLETNDLTWDSLNQMSQGEFETYNISPELKNRIPEFKDKMNRASELYNQAKAQVGENLAESYAFNGYMVEQLNPKLETLNTQIEEINKKYDPIKNKLSQVGKQLFSLNTEFASLKKQRDILTETIDKFYSMDLTQSDKRVKSAVSQRYSIEQRMDEIEVERKELKEGWNTKSAKTKDERLLKNLEYPIELASLQAKQEMLSGLVADMLATNSNILGNREKLDTKAEETKAEQVKEEIQNETNPENVVAAQETSTNPEVIETATQKEEELQDQSNITKTSAPDQSDVEGIKKALFELFKTKVPNTSWAAWEMKVNHANKIEDLMADYDVAKAKAFIPVLDELIAKTIDKYLSDRDARIALSKAKAIDSEPESGDITEEAYVGPLTSEQELPSDKESVPDKINLITHQYKRAKSGVPIKALGLEEDKLPDGTNTFDFTVINNPEFGLSGTKVGFKVYKEYYKNNSPETTFEDFVIFTTIGDKIIGKLPSTVGKEGDQINNFRALRKAIWNENINNKSSIVISSIESTISKKLFGRFDDTDVFQKPQEILAENEPLIFAIGVVGDGNESLITLNGLELKDRRLKTSKSTPGRLYQILQGANRVAVPVPVYVKKLKEVPEVYEKVTSLLKTINKDNETEVLKAVRQDVFFKVKPFNGDYSNITVRVSKDGQYVYEKHNMSFFIEKILPNFILQVDKSKINKGDYNLQVVGDGRAVTNINKGLHTHSASFQIEIPSVKIEDKPIISKDITLNDKKADIERRRKEELDEKIYSKGPDFYKPLGGEYSHEANELIASINAKYNAEIQALTEVKKPKQVEPATEVKPKKRKAKTDIQINLDEDPKFKVVNSNSTIRTWSDVFSEVFDNKDWLINSDLIIRRLLNKGYISESNPLFELANKVKKTNLSVKFTTEDKIQEQVKKVYGKSMDNMDFYMYISGNQLFINKDKINQFNSDIFAESFLHELVHAYTVSEYNSKYNKKFKAEVDELFNEAQELLEDKGDKWYGLTEPKEFIAEVMTNSDFIKEIKSKDKSSLPLWKRIINAITNLFFDVKLFSTDIVNKAQEVVNEVIDRINTGTNQEKFVPETLFKRPDGFTVDQWNSSIEMVNWVMLANIVPNLKERREYRHLSTPQILNKFGIKEMYTEVYVKLSDLWDKLIEEKSPNSDYIRSILDNLMILGEEEKDDKLGKLAESSAFALNSRGIQINLGDLIASELDTTETENDDQEAEIIDEEDEGSGFRDKPWAKSPEMRLSLEVRIALSYINEKDIDVKRKNEVGETVYENKKDQFGFNKFIDHVAFTRYLKRHLAGITTTQEMWDILNELKSSKPEVYQVIDLLKNDPELKSKFYINMSDQQATVLLPYVTQEADEEGNLTTIHKLINASRINADSILLSEWKSNYEVFKVDSEKATEAYKKYNEMLKDFLDIDKLTKTQTNRLSGILRKVGITIDPDTMKSIYENKGFIGFTNWLDSEISPKTILKKMIEGNVYENSFDESLRKAINNLVREVRAVEIDVQQGVIRNLEGENQNTLFSSNFISRTISRLKKDPKGFIKALQRDPWFKDFHLFKEFLSDPNYIERFKYYLCSGIKELGDKPTTYTKLSEAQYEIMCLTAFLNNGYRSYKTDKDTGKVTDLGYGVMMFPVPADAPQPIAFEMKRYTVGEILNNLKTVYTQEIARMKQVEALTTKGITIKNWSTQGKKFMFLPELNGKKLVKIDDITPWIEKNMEEELNKEIQSWKDMGLIIESEGNLSFTGQVPYELHILANSNQNVREAVKFYIYNRRFANIQQIMLINKDLAYFDEKKSDFPKRNKEGWSPVSQLDVDAIFEATGRTTYGTLYIRDKKRGSLDIKQIESSLDQDKSSSLTDTKRKNITDSFKEDIDETDAQALNRITAAKDILLGTGEFGKYEEAWPYLESGEPLPEHLKKTEINPEKPFVYNMTWSDELQSYVPTQNKNSEALLHKALYMKDGKVISDKLEAFDRLGELIGADKIMFTSAVKVGEYNAIDIEDFLEIAKLKPNSKELKEAITRLTKSIHHQSYYDYGKSNEVPSHLFDSRVRLGSQLTKLTIADLSKTINASNKDKQGYKIDGKAFTAKEITNLYHALHVANMEDDYLEAEKATEAKRLLDTLIKTAQERQMGEATIDGLRDLPVWFPTHLKPNERMYNSIYKNRVTIRYMNGAQVVQMSAFGFTEDEAKEFGIARPKVMKNEKGQIVQAEVLLPYHLADKIPDVNNVDPKLLESVGFRIPTEDMYSWMSFKVIGFLPRSEGNVIMLPREITKIDGSDFDIDKKFLLFYNFKKEGDKAVKDSFNINDLSDDLLNEYNSLLNQIKEYTREQRDNSIIDVIRAIQLHPDSYSRSMNPGGPHRLTKKAREVSKYIDIPTDLTMASTQRNVFMRIMAGKALIGVFANHNTSHAVIQHTNISLNPKKFKPVLFDNKSYFEINKVLDGSEESRISENVAEWLSAAVDNVKDPIFSYLNINSLTADLAAYLTRSGVKLETVGSFLAQPVLVELVRRYSNDGSRRYRLKGIISGLQSELINQLNEAYGGYNPDEVMNLRNFNNVELMNMIKAQKAEVKSESYLKGQLDVLEAFQEYYKSAEALGTLVSAFRIDTTGSGPTISASIARIDKIQQVIDSENFIGLESLIEGDDYPIWKAHLNLGLLNPTANALEVFPLNNTPLKQARKMLQDIKGKALDERETEYMNYMYMTFKASQFEFFQYNITEQNRLYKLVNQLDSIRQKNPDNQLLKRLFIKKEAEQWLITYNNIGKVTESERQKVTDGWENLLNGDEETKQFARDLVKYTFIQTGFTFGPSSFSHLVPVSFWANLKDNQGQSFIDFMKDKMIDPTEVDNNQSEEFVDQFLRNTFYKGDNYRYVESVNSNQIEVQTNNDGIPFLFKIKKESLPELSRLTDEGRVFKKYLTFNLIGGNKGNSYLFKHLGDGVYGVVNRLGKHNTWIEMKGNESNPASAYGRLSLSPEFPYARANYDILVNSIKKYINEKRLSGKYKVASLDAMEKYYSKFFPETYFEVKEIADTKQNITPKLKGQMTFSYGKNKRSDVQSSTTIEAIKNGERTATTRYESDGNIDYWKQAKVGDIVEFIGKGGESVLVQVTKELHKLKGSGKTAEQWSKLEGWSVEYFNSKVKPKLDEAWEIEYKLYTGAKEASDKEVEDRMNECEL